MIINLKENQSQETFTNKKLDLDKKRGYPIDITTKKEKGSEFMNRVPPLKTISQETNFHVDSDKKISYHKNEIPKNKLVANQMVQQNEIPSQEAKNLLNMGLAEKLANPNEEFVKLAELENDCEKAHRAQQKKNAEESEDQKKANVVDWLEQLEENAKNIDIDNLKLKDSAANALGKFFHHIKKNLPKDILSLTGKPDFKTHMRRMNNGRIAIFGSAEVLARMCGLSVRQFHRVKNILRKLGLIETWKAPIRYHVNATHIAFAVPLRVVEAILKRYLWGQKNKYVKKESDKKTARTINLNHTESSLTKTPKGFLVKREDSFINKKNVDNSEKWLITTDNSGNLAINTACTTWRSTGGFLMVDQIAHGLALSVNKFLPKEKQLEEKLTKKTARRLGNIRNKLARTPEELLHFLKAKEKKIQDSSYLQGKRESDKTGFAFNWSWDTFNLDFFERLLKGQYTDFESRTNSKTKLELEIKALERKNEERQRRKSEGLSLSQQIDSIRNDFLRDLHYEVASRFGGKAYIEFCNDINATYDRENKRFALTAKDAVTFAKWYPKLERLCGHVMGFDSFSVSGLTILAYGKRTVS